jgi:hypothetical protein
MRQANSPFSAAHTQSLSGAPDGEWRVSGYFLK